MIHLGELALTHHEFHLAGDQLRQGGGQVVGFGKDSLLVVQEVIDDLVEQGHQDR